MNALIKLNFLILVLLLGCTSKKTDQAVQISVTNKTSLELPDAVIRISDPAILKKIISLPGENIVVKSESILPVQLIYKNGTVDEILFLCQLAPGGKKEFSIMKSDEQPVFKRRTQAELSIRTGGGWQDRKYIGGEFKNVDFLRVPDEHTDHSFYIRYEGPGWESDKVGYRFYLDWRNATDVFGKKTDTMVLQNVGQDGFDSYHEMAGWGVDVLKVGDALGIGSIGHWTDKKVARVSKVDSTWCEITYSGVLESKITTSYFGWETGGKKTNLVSVLSIQAGSRLTRHDVKLSDELDNICTGIVKHPEARFIIPETSTGEWTWIANYGKQTLQEDMLGMAVIYKPSELISLEEDEYNHVVVLNPSGRKFTWYFLAAWEQEPGGIRNRDEFLRYLDQQVEILNALPEVRLVED